MLFRSAMIPVILPTRVRSGACRGRAAGGFTPSSRLGSVWSSGRAPVECPPRWLRGGRRRPSGRSWERRFECSAPARYTSRMVVPVVVLLAAAALYWLSVMDRASVLAISLVELEGKVGVPLWIPFAGIGGVLLIARLIHGEIDQPVRGDLLDADLRRILEAREIGRRHRFDHLHVAREHRRGEIGRAHV